MLDKAKEMATFKSVYLDVLTELQMNGVRGH